MTNNSIFTANKLFNLKDWVAVVTGGGTGIGLMCAQTLANNGARVYIVGRRAEALEQAVKAHGHDIENGGKLIPITADTTSKESIQQLVGEISKKETHINVLVNNAGIAGKERHSVEKGDESAKALHDQLWRIGVDEFEDVYRTNVVGYYFTTVAFLPLLAAATQNTPGHSACVINNTSISGTTRTSQHHIQYNVSKSAATHLNTLLSQELSRPAVKVRVNAFSPGIFPSQMSTGGTGDDQKSHISAEGFGEKKCVPAGRPGRDEDIAQVLLTLVTDTYINGQNIHVDGGYLLEHP